MSTEDIKLPDHVVPTANGEINLSEVPSAWLVLYFYPKDSTPGCTTQALEFTELKDQFDAMGATVVGISRDSVKSHQNFTNKQELQIELVSDADEILCKHFDVIKEKNMYGKKVMGIERSTFLFHNNQLMKSYRKVTAAGHAAQVLDDIRTMSEVE